jgi:hypothetical protein
MSNDMEPWDEAITVAAEGLVLSRHGPTALAG